MTPVRKAHGTRTCKPAEEWRAQRLHARLGEDASREDDQYPFHELQQSEQHPGHDCGGRAERGAGSDGGELVGVWHRQVLREPESRR